MSIISKDCLAVFVVVMWCLIDGISTKTTAIPLNSKGSVNLPTNVPMPIHDNTPHNKNAIKHTEKGHADSLNLSTGKQQNEEVILNIPNAYKEELYKKGQTVINYADHKIMLHYKADKDGYVITYIYKKKPKVEIELDTRKMDSDEGTALCSTTLKTACG